MISNMKIRNFKCFKRLNVNFGNMTILTGANASGKSTVIQAMMLYYGSRKYGNAPIDLRETLGIQVGGAKNLVSQFSDSTDESAFSICVDENVYDFYYDKMTSLNLLKRVCILK